MPSTMPNKPVSQVANVNIEATPEPFTLVLSIGAIGLAARRQIRRAA